MDIIELLIIVVVILALIKFLSPIIDFHSVKSYDEQRKEELKEERRRLKPGRKWRKWLRKHEEVVWLEVGGSNTNPNNFHDWRSLFHIMWEYKRENIPFGVKFSGDVVLYREFNSRGLVTDTGLPYNFSNAVYDIVHDDVPIVQFSISDDYWKSIVKWCTLGEVRRQELIDIGCEEIPYGEEPCTKFEYNKH